MIEFRIIIVMIILLELGIFACGLKIVSNRHAARELFIQLEKEQQAHNLLMDERSRLKLEVARLEQTAKVKEKAENRGLKAADPSKVVLIAPDGSTKELNNGKKAGEEK